MLTARRKRLAPANALHQPKRRVLALADSLRLNGYDELAEEMRVLVEGDDPEDDSDAFGNPLG